jgi:hypothetical protein
VAASAPSRIRDKCVVKLLRMGEVASTVLEFVMDVLINWRAVIAVFVFGMFSLPNAALSAKAKQTFDEKWPVEARRKWLVRIAVAYIFVSCFFVWKDERDKVTELTKKLDDRLTQQQDKQKRQLIAGKLTELLAQSDNFMMSFATLPTTVTVEDYNKIVVDTSRWSEALESYVVHELGSEKYRLRDIPPNPLIIPPRVGYTGDLGRYISAETSALLIIRSSVVKIIEGLESN